RKDMDRTGLEVTGEYGAHDVCLLPDDLQAAVVRQVTQRWTAAHPHALRLGGCDLVADALPGHLTFELREGQEHVESEPAHAAGSIERLGDRDEGYAPAIECLD